MGNRPLGIGSRAGLYRSLPRAFACGALCGEYPRGESVSALFISELERLLKYHQVEPRQLILEISEALVTVDSSAGFRTINRLRQMGCRIAIGNFGASYASYLQLKNLQADMLKIDGSFIHNMLHNPLDYQIIESICRVARLKRMQIVAESVESEAVATALRGLGIDYLQGYAISELQPLTMLGES